MNQGNELSIAGANSTKQYNNVYNYPIAQPNTLGSIEGQLHGQHYDFKWDANGNMIYQHEHQARSERFMCWDEENRLTTVKDGDYMSAYLYDHAGERVWKMTGEVQSMSINGQYYIDQVALDRKTLYTNPYLIVTEAEYTKHYYAESQRIASKLGGGWAQAGYDPLQDHLPDTLGFEHQILNDLLIDRLLDNAKCAGVHAAEYYDAFEAIQNQLSTDDPEVNRYFYHPDYLGSSSFITNASGDVDQHLQYLPFGEPWIDQRTQNNIRFTFSGKERDEETGYNYFGARYYNSDISIWLSVDPMASERAWLTPYNYVQNNPLKLIDPTGMLDEPPTKPGKHNGEIHYDHDTGTQFEWNSEHKTWYGTDWNLDAVDVIDYTKTHDFFRNNKYELDMTSSSAEYGSALWGVVFQNNFLKYVGAGGSTLNFTLAKFEYESSQKGSGDLLKMRIKQANSVIGAIPNSYTTMLSIGISLFEGNGGFDSWYDALNSADNSKIFVTPPMYMNFQFIIPNKNKE